LDQPREINPWWRSDDHVHVRLEHRELDDLDVLTGCSLLEEFLQK